jgi:hypothetical protein
LSAPVPKGKENRGAGRKPDSITPDLAPGLFER